MNQALPEGGLDTRTTGLEPATTGSTVRYSNQLSYVPKTPPILAAGARMSSVLAVTLRSSATHPRETGRA
jgi:hypothetical protein